MECTPLDYIVSHLTSGYLQRGQLPTNELAQQIYREAATIFAQREAILSTEFPAVWAIINTPTPTP